MVLPTYIMTPGETERFSPSHVRKISEDILKRECDARVNDKTLEYWLDDGEDFDALAKDIAAKIKAAVRAQTLAKRYKLVVQVTLGQRKDQGVRITSRCLWDTQTDNYATCSYKNDYIWASAMVFGLYAE